MTVAVSNVALTDAGTTWLNRTNELATIATYQAVTVSNTSSNTTTGNGVIVGIFGSTTLFSTDAMRGGNVSTSNTLQITSNVSISNSMTVSGPVTLSSNVSLTGNVISGVSVSNTITVNAAVTTSATANGDLGSGLVTAQTIFSFDKTLYFSGDVAVQARRLGNTHIIKGIIAQDGTTAYMSVYGSISSPAGANLGVLSANLASNGTHVDIRFLQTAANTAVKISTTLFK